MPRLEIELPARPPFDFTKSLRFVCNFPATDGEQHLTQTTMTKAWRTAGTTVATRLTQTGSQEAPALHCTLTATQSITPQIRDAVCDRLRFFLGLDDDLADFYHVARSDPGFAHVVRHLYGYHQVKFPTPLEQVCWAILAQRTPMPAARGMKRALMDTFGNRIDHEAGPLWAFPDLEQLLSLPEGRLAEIIGNPRKAKYLYGAVHTFAEADEEFLRSGPFDEVKQFLLSLPGIGPWSASFILVRGLGRMDQMPADTPALKAAARAYGQALSAQEFEALATRYGHWQGYWGHYLRAAS
uniref:DNA-3-methyladenine glycosylase II n=1 Tax=Streptomyces sp. NBC_00003 TaxID=2903608 RepID=A0AAU2VC54_9ACTN